jgi:hypothetical protein
LTKRGLSSLSRKLSIFITTLLKLFQSTYQPLHVPFRLRETFHICLFSFDVTFVSDYMLSCSTGTRCSVSHLNQYSFTPCTEEFQRKDANTCVWQCMIYISRIPT